MVPDVEFVDICAAGKPAKVTQNVPITPTQKMIAAGHKEAIWGSGDVALVWAAMLKAAPNA